MRKKVAKGTVEKYEKLKTEKQYAERGNREEAMCKVLSIVF